MPIIYKPGLGEDTATQQQGDKDLTESNQPENRQKQDVKIEEQYKFYKHRQELAKSGFIHDRPGCKVNQKGGRIIRPILGELHLNETNKDLIEKICRTVFGQKEQMITTEFIREFHKRFHAKIPTKNLLALAILPARKDTPYIPKELREDIDPEKATAIINKQTRLRKPLVQINYLLAITITELAQSLNILTCSDKILRFMSEDE